MSEAQGEAAEPEVVVLSTVEEALNLIKRLQESSDDAVVPSVRFEGELGLSE